MKNLKFENATITEKEGQLVITEEVEGKQIERDLINELSVYFGVPGLNFKLNKARKSNPRKSATKYFCECGTKISSGSEDLAIKCLNCGAEFKKPE